MIFSQFARASPPVSVSAAITDLHSLLGCVAMKSTRQRRWNFLLFCALCRSVDLHIFAQAWSSQPSQQRRRNERWRTRLRNVNENSKLPLGSFTSSERQPEKSWNFDVKSGSIEWGGQNRRFHSSSCVKKFIKYEVRDADVEEICVCCVGARRRRNALIRVMENQKSWKFFSAGGVIRVWQKRATWKIPHLIYENGMEAFFFFFGTISLVSRVRLSSSREKKNLKKTRRITTSEDGVISGLGWMITMMKFWCGKIM